MISGCRISSQTVVASTREMFGALESHAEGMLWIAPRDAKGDVDFELSLASTGDKVVLRESSDEFFFAGGPQGAFREPRQPRLAL